MDQWLVVSGKDGSLTMNFWANVGPSQRTQGITALEVNRSAANHYYWSPHV